MQHDHVLEKFIFDLLTPSPALGEGEGGRRSVGKIFATMLMHSQFSLIEMQHDHILKRLNFDLLTQSPGSEGGLR